MLQVSRERQIDITISCCALHNFIRMHEKGILILPKPTNITTIPNIGLYDGGNNQAMNECRDAIANMISTSINNDYNIC